jgi:hypothetical protein
MKTSAIARFWRSPLAHSAVRRTARLSIFGLVGWFWFLSGTRSPSKALGLVAVLVLAALVGIAWYVSRAQADRRQRAAFDRYARMEQAKATHSPRSSRSHPRPAG